jgi:hypothetical protein
VQFCYAKQHGTVGVWKQFAASLVFGDSLSI